MVTTPSDPRTTALLAHVVSQVQQNVEFLMSQNYMSNADGATVLSKLPNLHTNANADRLAPRVDAMSANEARPPLAYRGVPPPQPDHRTIRARALWAYNENGQEVDDLSFSAGDIIEVVSETNDDWWMGKVNGKQALFPSSYVEKMETGAPESAMSSSGYDAAGTMPAPSQEKPVYRPFGAAYHGNDLPPSNGEVNSMGLQQDPGQAQKKSKFGKFGNTMAHSAAGGVGFGAGAAIGGGLVRAIF